MYTINIFLGWAHDTGNVNIVTILSPQPCDPLSPYTNLRCGFFSNTLRSYMGRHHIALSGSRTLRSVFHNDGTKPVFKDAVIV
jgi:hypothetical protein